MSLFRRGGDGLASRAAAGDAAAMKSIYDSHVRYLTAVCLRYIPSEDEAKDVLQEAFIKIFSSIGTFRGSDSALRAWMRRIVVNEALMHLRRRSKDPLVLGDNALPHDVPEEDPEPEGIPPDVLQQMIMRLPEGCRAIFNLYVFEQKSHKEIARLLGIKENSSTSQFHRAKSLMASMIKDYRDAQRLEK
ncbi:MAG: RNA polymerase sigma factor [Candidatus Cryptobacteroides sp.]